MLIMRGILELCFEHCLRLLRQVFLVMKTLFCGLFCLVLRIFYHRRASDFEIIEIADNFLIKMRSGKSL